MRDVQEEPKAETALCGAFAKPSDGLEPSTPSLPWRCSIPPPATARSVHLEHSPHRQGSGDLGALVLAPHPAELGPRPLRGLIAASAVVSIVCSTSVCESRLA